MFIRVVEEFFWIDLGEGDGMKLSLFLRVEDDGRQFAEWFAAEDGDPAENPHAAALHSVDLTAAGDDPAKIEAEIATYVGALDTYDPEIHGDGEAPVPSTAEAPSEDVIAAEDAVVDTGSEGGRNTPSCARAAMIRARNVGSPDLWTIRDRTEANLCAMEIIATVSPSDLSDADRAALRTYSGWGGLKRKAVMARFPKGIPVPEERGLIHEYYTPTIVAREVERVVSERMSSVPRQGSDLPIALEPSAGIGRFIEAFGTERVAWTAIEYSEVSARLLGALYPEIDLFTGPFEQWVSRESYKIAGRIGLVISNPPYPKVRGVARAYDPNPLYDESAASSYFLRRGLDMLDKGGIGAYLIPAGFMSGKGRASIDLREKVLKRHHVLAAFRLPSLTFPGANLVIDLIFFRARGGELASVLESDQSIHDGLYFKEHPSHILGIEVGSDDKTDEEDQSKGAPTKRGRFSKYKVEGEFRGLPPFVDRPFVEGELSPYDLPTAPVEKVRKRRRHVDTHGMDEAVAQATRLGVRVDRYFSALSASQNKSHVEAWPELHGDLLAWSAAYGNPHEHVDLRVQANLQNADVQAFLQAFQSTGELTVTIATQPTWEGHYNGSATDIPAIANYLYRSAAGLTLEKLAERLSIEANWSSDRALSAVEAALPELYNAGWRLEGDDWRELLPVEESLRGKLWPRYDRCNAMVKGATEAPEAFSRIVRDGKVWGSLGMDRIREQAQELYKAIGPVGYEDILAATMKIMAESGSNGSGDIDPRQGWMPLSLVSEWVSDWMRSLIQNEIAATNRWRKREELNNELRRFKPIELVREGGMVIPKGIDPEDPAIRSTLDHEYGHTFRMFIGWANTNYALFLFSTNQEEKDAGITVESKRRDWETPVLSAFRAWVGSRTDRQRVVEEAYNRTFLGDIPYVYTSEPIHIERWGEKIQLNAHQTRGVRKIVANRGGLLAFDVGVGKTFAGIACVARARQEGWARRPVVLVPNTIVWKWDKDFKLCAPDYRVVIIGSSEKEVPFDKVYPMRKGKSTDPTIVIYDPDGRKRRVHRYEDDPIERGQKWRDFQAGRYDVAIVAYSMLDRTELDDRFIEEYALRTAAIQRELTLRARNARKVGDDDGDDDAVAMGSVRDGKTAQLSERQEAISNETAAEWIKSVNTLREDYQYDHGIRWSDIGVDMIVVDEAQNFKNLYLPAKRTDHGPWKFMGNEGEGAKRAWQLDFRCESIRQRSGGGGVVLLSATPAKNSPLEFYNIIQYIDHRVWERYGINDPEAFIDRYIVPGNGYFASGSGDLREGTVAIAFKNLDEIRGVIFRYGDFVTAEDANIELPATSVRYLSNDGRSYRMETRDGESVWFDPDGKETFITQVGLSMDPEQQALDDHWRAEAAAAAAKRNDPGKILRAMSMRHALSIHPSLCDRQRVERKVKKGTKAAKEGKKTEIVNVAFWDWNNADQNPKFETVKFIACAKAIVRRLSCGHVMVTPDAEETIAMLVGVGVPEDKILHVTDEDESVDFSRFPLGRIRSPGDYEVIVCSPDAFVRHDIKDHACTRHNLGDPALTEEKKVELCKQVFRSRTCGHIVFVESVPGHVWLKKTLVKHGVPADRIAILNAESAPDSSDRQNLAERFNGNPDVKMEPEFDVIICNSVAYEGIDLQARTCAIHHIDLPHDPSTLQQRNGRGVRQGNTMGGIEILYYFLQCSDDGARFTNINGKRGWMVSLLKNQDRSTNNPAAQMSPLDQLALLTCDVDQAKKLFAEAKTKRDADNARGKTALVVNSMRVANGKFRRAEWIGDVEAAAYARVQGEEALAKALALSNGLQWDWREIAPMVRDRPMLIPRRAPQPLLYEGMKARVISENDRDEGTLVELGKLYNGGEGISFLENDEWSIAWKGTITLASLESEGSQSKFVADGVPGAELGWKNNDDKVFARYVERARGHGLRRTWEMAETFRASDEWLQRFWEQSGEEFVMRSYRVREEKILFLRRGEGFTIGGRGEVQSFAEVIPPTRRGYEEFLVRAAKTPRSMLVDSEGEPLTTNEWKEYGFTELHDQAKLWWGYSMPTGIYAHDK